MKFINRGGPIKIRIGEPDDCYWATIRKGESVDLTLELGLAYGFSVKTTEGQIGNKKVETKQIETDNNTDKKTDDFYTELCSINGIGKKTAKDLVLIFGTLNALVYAIKSGKEIPVRDDIENLLRKKYE